MTTMDNKPQYWKEAITILDKNGEVEYMIVEVITEEEHIERMKKETATCEEIMLINRDEPSKDSY